MNIAISTQAQLPKKLDDNTDVTNVFASEKGLYYYASFNKSILPKKLEQAKAEMEETVRTQSCATQGVPALLAAGASIHWHYSDPAGHFFDVTVDRC